jgi:hypothetical protein
MFKAIRIPHFVIKMDLITLNMVVMSVDNPCLVILAEWEQQLLVSN